jgi:uncharacterized membrane protein
MLFIRVFLGYIEFTKISPLIFDYPHFIIVIMHLGLPLGSLLGIWIANKCLSKASTFSIRGAALGFAFSFLGVLLLGIVIIVVTVVLVAEGPGGEVNVLVRLLRSELSFVLLLISAGLFATIGYNLGLRRKRPDLKEHVTP